MVPVCWSPSHTASFPPGVRMPRICAQHQAKFWWWKPTGMVVDLSLEVASQSFKWFPVAKLHRTCLDWLEGSSPQSQAGASGNSLEGALPAWMRVDTTWPPWETQTSHLLIKIESWDLQSRNCPNPSCAIPVDLLRKKHQANSICKLNRSCHWELGWRSVRYKWLQLRKKLRTHGPNRRWARHWIQSWLGEQEGFQQFKEKKLCEPSWSWHALCCFSCLVFWLLWPVIFL